MSEETFFTNIDVGTFTSDTKSSEFAMHVSIDIKDLPRYDY